MSQAEPSRDGRLEGKVALVTGAASGIGRAAAWLFAGEGARVMAFDLQEELLARLAGEAAAEGLEIQAFHGDASDEDDVRRAVEKTMDTYGELHVLYANAAVFRQDVDHSVTETELADWNDILAVNVGGPFLLCKYGIPRLKAAGGGSIILMGSISALAGFRAAEDAYTTGKGALISLTRSLAVQFAADGIRANIIHPGMILTPIHDKHLVDPAWLPGICERIPMGRLGTAEEIAQVALFLASDESAYVTGAELLVDGGFMAQ